MSLSKISVNSPVAKQIAEALGTTPKKLDQSDDKSKKEDGFIDLFKIAMDVSAKEQGPYRASLVKLLFQRRDYHFEGTLYCQKRSPDPYSNIEACFIQKQDGNPALLVYETQVPKEKVKIFNAGRIGVLWQMRAILQDSELSPSAKKYLSDGLRPETKLEIELGAALLGGFADDIKLFNEWLNAQVQVREEGQSPQTRHPVDRSRGPYDRGPAGGDAAEPWRMAPVPVPR